jgi:very-short-patch-repair endonuclease
MILATWHTPLCPAGHLPHTGGDRDAAPSVPDPKGWVNREVFPDPEALARPDGRPVADHRPEIDSWLHPDGPERLEGLYQLYDIARRRYPVHPHALSRKAVAALPISPLVGEMSGRTEGGSANRAGSADLLAMQSKRRQGAVRSNSVSPVAMPHTPVPPQRRANAKRMRRAMTDAELKLWNAVRAHRLMGLSFRRQMPIAGYIVDFACPDERLIVELDGSQHGDDRTIRYDAVRTARLEADAWTLLRFWNDDVLKDLDNVCLHILTVIGRMR